MVWPFSNQQPAPQTGALGLGAVQPNGYASHPQFAQPSPYGSPYAQQQGGFNAFASGASGGAYNPNQPITPPSELEMVSMLLHHQKPIDQFLMGPNLNLLISIMANIVNLSLVEFFRHARYTEDDNGKLMVDITSLPTQYQTLSAENVTADLTALQASCNQAVQQSLMEQQQLLAMAQQSMMHGMLDGAFSDPGMMEKAGGAMSGLARGLVGMR
jgi:hypothetical protein